MILLVEKADKESLTLSFALQLEFFRPPKALG